MSIANFLHENANPRVPHGAIPAITIWQPWASALALGVKHYETRGWSTRYRGPMAIHAGSRKPTRDDMRLAKFAGLELPETLPRGAVIAIGELTDCILGFDPDTEMENALGFFGPRRYAWKFENVRPFAAPVPAKGQQGIWAWTPTVEVLRD